MHSLKDFIVIYYRGVYKILFDGKEDRILVENLL